ncbi:S-adenosylmethionine:tRNA ribosyltransferase-isomerase [Granulibacter bethesdensis]|uniref:S-adenosylmethionine:tRNA ribosyltransferase-isomerase n=1 Tax=Granulibacter bethesdensis TaxID=364410 RepID=A0AAN0VEW8_9PROT|nr:tRNA preQ1(34) S-adenosylmethionine ribosyltransferase-isomerase QueA [Granulibacter bethesdensis]AHJ62049.1 S-adenosylmethionine:tRNA ribosyltransferase-isomerase [Granulibacter bethesdensis]
MSTAPLDIADFTFDLPPERIAHEPARPRESARLLHVPAGEEGVHDHHIRDLPDLLRPGDVLVANDTRVIPAQLTAWRGQARIGLTLNRPLPDGSWHVLARNARRLRAGDRLRFTEHDTQPTHTQPTGMLAAEVVARDEDGGAILRFVAEDFDAALAQYGALALPPYIDRPQGPTDQDAKDYQTVFARHRGAVAAPTAGLHFTPALLDRLAAKGIERVTITLHVGAGTFLPMRDDTIEAHRLHAERGVITPEAASRINAAKRVIAVGTTSLRLLESAADAAGCVRPFDAETDIFIKPGHRFRTAHALLTNFHLPRSTLFMLVCAFAGTARMRAAYAYAIAEAYRFYSYGDACLIERDLRDRH